MSSIANRKLRDKMTASMNETLSDIVGIFGMVI